VRGKVVNCFYDGSESGFGDFLRGSIHLYEICKAFGLDFDIDDSHHPINEFIKTDYNIKFNKSEIYCLIKKLKKDGYTDFVDSLNKLLFNLLKSTKNGDINYIFSYYHHCSKARNECTIPYINKLPPLSKECSDFFKNRLKFSDEIENSIKEELQSRDLKPKKFNIIHFRLGDEKSFYKKGDGFHLHEPSNKDCLEICEQKLKRYKYPLVVISDNNELKSYLKQKSKEKGLNLHVFHTESSHTQKNPSGSKKEESVEVTKTGLFYAVFDMRLASLASRGSSYSVYNHGSGFFAWICKIYRVPFYLKKFHFEPEPEEPRRRISNCVDCHDLIFDKQ